MTDTKAEALEKAAKQFRFYEESHRAKEPPQHDKADTNKAMAEMCEAALLSSEPRAERLRDALLRTTKTEGPNAFAYARGIAMEALLKDQKEHRAALSTEPRVDAMREALVPCDVMLAPGTVIRKGCQMSTLLNALERRRLQGGGVQWEDLKEARATFAAEPRMREELENARAIVDQYEWCLSKGLVPLVSVEDLLKIKRQTKTNVAALSLPEPTSDGAKS